MLQNLTGWHALVILAVVLLVFGATKLPALAKSVGQSMKILKDEVHDSSSTTTPSAATTAPAEPVAVAVPVTTTATVQPATERVAS